MVQPFRSVRVKEGDWPPNTMSNSGDPCRSVTVSDGACRNLREASRELTFELGFPDGGLHLVEKWGWEGHSGQRNEQVQRALGAFGKGGGRLDMNDNGLQCYSHLVSRDR